MDRKDFLKTLATAGVATSMGVSARIPEAQAESAENIPDMVAVLGGEPVAMFEKAIAAMGGMGQYVKKGQKVAIKPNIAWDRTPEMGANTNPELVAAVVKACLDAGAAEVVVFDHSCDDMRKCYKTSGVEAAAVAAGARVLPSDEERYYREVSIPQGKNLTSAKIHEAILDCDVWFNVPVLKVHMGAKLTSAMKNYLGIVWDRQYFHRNDLSQCIADACTFEKKPALNIVDAYRIMKSNGPRGKSKSDVVTAKGLFISSNIVAVDTAATKFLGQVQGMTVEDVNHLKFGEELNLGSTDLGQLKIERIKM